MCNVSQEWTQVMHCLSVVVPGWGYKYSVLAVSYQSKGYNIWPKTQAEKGEEVEASWADHEHNCIH